MAQKPYQAAWLSIAAGKPYEPMHPVRDASGLAAPSKLRGAITQTPRQPGIEAPSSLVSSPLRLCTDDSTGWARLLKHVVAIDLERGSRGQLGTLRMIAALPFRPVIRHLLRPLQRATDPAPLAPARLEPGQLA